MSDMATGRVCSAQLVLKASTSRLRYPWESPGRFGVNMGTVLFLLHRPIGGLKPLFVFYFRVEEKFAGGKFREIPFTVDIIFAGGKFRAKSKFRKYRKLTPREKLVLNTVAEARVYSYSRAHASMTH